MTTHQYREQHDTTKTLLQLFDRSDIPEWISPDIDVEDLIAITEGGCESGAYMPTVTYHKARETMNRHGDDVVDFIRSHAAELPRPSDNESWSGIAFHYLSHAVELYARFALMNLGIDG